MIILAGLLILALAGMLRVYYINYSTRKIELERELKVITKILTYERDFYITVKKTRI